MVTAYLGELLDIDAYNQPGVEESKIAAYAMLGNTEEKYQNKYKEMVSAPKGLKKYLL
jgi:glucose-6-phosphate isomerase